MIKRKWFCSLRAKLLWTLLLAAALGFGTFFAVQAGTGRLVERLYLSQEATQRRNSRLSQSLQQYVVQNQLSSTDAQAISDWIAQQGDLYLLFYQDESYSCGSGLWGVDQAGNFYINDDISTSNAVCTVGFSDGNMVVELCDYSVQKLYTIAGVMSVVLGCAVFTLVVSLYYRRLTGSVIRLSQDVREIGNGNIDKSIYLAGTDELAALAQDVDAMRRAILGRIKKEKQAYRSNADLLTAISHDIRTPLTALIGYLDLLVSRQYDTEEQSRQYLMASQEKAMQLKDLTERLFQYFMVFSGEELPIRYESYDAQPVLEQLLGEPVAQLRMKGFQVRMIGLKEPCRIATDMLYLKRVFDNLFSNVEKHADRSRPVVILSQREGGMLHICLSNWMPQAPNRVESTKIGLKTCQRIMEQLSGRLIITQEGLKFTAEAALPLAQIDA